jgi:polysaccharide biosynthesis protein VpsQ
MKNSSESPAIASQNISAPAKVSKKIMALAFAYAGFFFITLWAAYHNHLPLQWLSQFPNYDKLGHLVIYCTATYLGHRLCRQKHFSKNVGKKDAKNGQVIRIPAFPAFFVLFTIAEELMQGFSPYRTLDAGDMVCSLFGIAAGYWLAQRSKG